jgi:hypothetical protein
MSDTHFHYRLRRSPGHSGARIIKLIKNLTNHMVNQTSNRPDSSELPQTTVIRPVDWSISHQREGHCLGFAPVKL